MAKYTLEEIMYGEKYGIESAVFVEVFKTQRDGSIVFNLTMTPPTPILTPFLL